MSVKTIRKDCGDGVSAMVFRCFDTSGVSECVLLLARFSLVFHNLIRKSPLFCVRTATVVSQMTLNEL